MSNDLNWLLEPGAKPPTVTKAAKRRAEKAAKAWEAKKEEERAIHALQRAVDAMSVWTPIATVSIFYATRCACGTEFEVPEVSPLGIQSQHLVRFVHKYTGAIWEKRCDSGNVPTGLPHLLRKIDATCPLCPACAKEGNFAQLTLNLEI